ncbi:hypothetical protein ACFYNY_19685 [Streptomyces sp. NPDC006530]|uniref:hypothetical protein n=1 Tax=Streptomyces sp. NPDC006530 TaxID=3364750 RepID=UPI0036900FEB
MGGLILVLALIWLFIAWVPARFPSLDPAWGWGVLALSALLIIIYARNSQWAAQTIAIVIAVAPGVIVTLLRMRRPTRGV